MRLGAGIVIGACILATSAAMLPALPQSGDLVPFDAGYLETAAFIDDSLQAVRQDAATESDQQAPPIFGMETEPVAGEVAAQWGVADHWSPPFETLQTHRGDCEDYAIVKYVALLQAGLSHDDVKIVILRNLLPKEDHAVVAARVDGQWLILDNRRLALVRDTKMVGSIPKFVLDEDGTRRFVPSNRAGQGPSAGRSSPARFVRPA